MRNLSDFTPDLYNVDVTCYYGKRWMRHEKVLTPHEKVLIPHEKSINVAI